MTLSNSLGGSVKKDGPITVCSNTLTYDPTMHLIQYAGNVTVMQAKDLNVLCHANNNEAAMLPNSLALPDMQKTASADDFLKATLNLVEKSCQKLKACRFMQGQKLNIYLDKKNQKVEHIVMTSAMPHYVQYYSQTEDTKHNEGNQGDKPNTDKVYAKGQKMTFNQLTHKLVIEKNAVVAQNQNQFKGKKVIYNAESGLVTVPNTGERATVILDHKNF